MKARIDASRARSILTRCGAFGDFHALSSATVDSLIEEANAYGYRRPRNANGSRARSWHAYLVRAAGWQGEA